MGNDAATVERVGLEVLWEDVAAGVAGVDVPVRWSDGAMAAEHEVTGQERSDREQVLVRGACLGDEGALEALCHDEWHHVHKLVAGTVAEPIEAEELTLEVFARAIARLAHFPYEETSFRSYLFQLARHLLSDRWRSEVALRGCELRTVPTGAVVGEPGAPTDGRGPATVPWGPAARGFVPVPRAFPPPPAPEGTGTIVLTSDHRRQLEAALDRLPDRCRELLHLRLVEGWSTAEIGAEWGRTPEAVRRVQRQALQALRTEVEGHGAP